MAHFEGAIRMKMPDVQDLRDIQSVPRVTDALGRWLDEVKKTQLSLLATADGITLTRAQGAWEVLTTLERIVRGLHTNAIPQPGMDRQ